MIIIISIQQKTILGGDWVLTYVVRNCLYCGMKIFYKGRGRPPKYCPICADIKKHRYMRWYMNRYRRLGTTDLHEHRHKDFERERKTISFEKKRLGLTWKPKKHHHVFYYL